MLHLQMAGMLIPQFHVSTLIRRRFIRFVQTSAKSTVMPLWEYDHAHARVCLSVLITSCSLEYSQQLKDKTAKVARELQTVQQRVSSDISIPIRVVASPATIAYRNKTEFSIGLDAQEQPTVGFQCIVNRQPVVLVQLLFIVFCSVCVFFLFVAARLALRGYLCVFFYAVPALFAKVEPLLFCI